MKRYQFFWSFVITLLTAALGTALLSIYFPPPTADGLHMLHNISIACTVLGGIGLFLILLEALVS